MGKISEITVHGRFQPPIHVNHWNYIREGFTRAEHVTLLITNPFQDEAYDATAAWRNDPANNPFTYDDRKFMFECLLGNLGIDRSRYDIKPFNIKDPASFNELDPEVPNLVNVYSEWSEKKDTQFKKQGLKTIRLEMPKTVPVSGTILRTILEGSHQSDEALGLELVEAGLLEEALPGLLTVMQAKREAHEVSRS
jgi:nicotinamide mononucleotide adenylyltransferase